MLLLIYRNIENYCVFPASVRLTSMDVDGPCAFPRPNSIQESVAGPISALGFILIFLSFALAQMFLTTDDLNNLANANRRHDNRNQSSVEVNIDMQPSLLIFQFSKKCNTRFTTLP